MFSNFEVDDVDVESEDKEDKGDKGDHKGTHDSLVPR